MARASGASASGVCPPSRTASSAWPIPSSIQAYARRVGHEFSRLRPQRAAKPAKAAEKTAPAQTVKGAVAVTAPAVAPGAATQ